MLSSLERYGRTRPTSRRAWRAWLRKHNAALSGVWLVYSKRTAGRQPLSYDAAVEEALCFGWIDSIVRTIDERSYRQLFTPRKPGSTWSVPNKRRVASLIKRDRMTEAGMAKVRAAKRDGTWNALTKIDRLVLPAELTKAFRANKAARSGFDAWSLSTKRAVLWWLHTAKRPATRQARLQEILRAATTGTKPRPMAVRP